MRGICTLSLDLRGVAREKAEHSHYTGEFASSVSMQGDLWRSLNEDWHPNADSMNGATASFSLDTSSALKEHAAKLRDTFNDPRIIGAVIIPAFASGQLPSAEEGQAARSIHGWASVTPEALARCASLLSYRGPDASILSLSILVLDAESDVSVSPGHLYRSNKVGYGLVGFSLAHRFHEPEEEDAATR